LKRFSIVVGYRNRELSRVKRSLDSLSRQSFSDFELIFVDYGSDFNQASAVKKLIGEYPFVKYFHSYTQGWFWNRAHALNTGAKLAHGPFLEKVNNLSFEKSFYTFSCYYLPENFKYDSAVLERDGIHYEQNYVGLCAVSREAVYNVNGYDEYFMVWGVEDDDFYECLKKSGIIHVHNPLSTYTTFHQWHQTHSPLKPTLWYLQMVQYLCNKKSIQFEKNDNWGKWIPQTERFLNDEFPSLRWDLELRVSSKSGYLLFNPLIDAIKNPTFRQIYFEFTCEQNQNKRRKWFKFCKTKNTQNSLGDISINDVLDFVQYFIGISRHKLADYSIVHNNKTIKLGLVKSDESS